MNASETASELRRLRVELEALKQSRQQSPQPAAGGARLSGAAVDPATSRSASRWNAEDIEQQLKKITGLIRDEVDERPLLAMLLVFALGFLLGRLLR